MTEMHLAAALWATKVASNSVGQMEQFFDVTEHRRLMKRSRKQAQALLKLLAAASRAANVREARCVQNVLFRSREFKLLAAERACRRFHSSHRPANVVSLASRLDCRKPSYELAGLNVRRKSNGGTRCIVEYGIENVARQLMADMVLRTTFTPSDWQFERKGGGHNEAVAAILDSLHDCGWAACLDIKDCFASFEEEGLAKLLPLPREVTRHVIMTGVLAGTGSLSSIRLRAQAQITRLGPPRGLPQGSVTSNTVASFAFKGLGRSIGPRCRLFGFRDDLLVVGPSRCEVDESARSIRQELLEHPAGRFELGRFEVASLDHGFEFLGYRFCRLGGKPLATPKPENLEKIEARFRDALACDLQAGRDRPVKAARVLAASRRAFPHWRFANITLNDNFRLAHELLAQVNGSHGYRPFDEKNSPEWLRWLRL